MIEATVILCTRNPHPGRLDRTLAGLAAQTLDVSNYEILFIDNGSTPPLSPVNLPSLPANLRIVPEPRPGLTPARLRGIVEARGELLVFVDDDNVLSNGFLRDAVSIFQQHPNLAAAGGPVRSEFESPPPPWLAEFYSLLALHDHGPRPLIADGGARAPLPSFAPVGAGLCLRRTHALIYAESARTDPLRAAFDRRAGALTSGGDNDIILTALHAGGGVGYFPVLALTHLIPAFRMEPRYLQRLNRGIQKSWMQVLTLHNANPWPPIPGWTLTLRKIKAWFAHRAWSSPVARIRWQGACGHFEGRLKSHR
ncbi:glycosyltransferase [Opitutaceae bacterium TAV4]|nr:glycosyltransferase [Opitutaceae bacterium TAV4]RRK00721.1 glycosyltransferase [Opitutaceae bacterium TAV3]